MPLTPLPASIAWDTPALAESLYAIVNVKCLLRFQCFRTIGRHMVARVRRSMHQDRIARHSSCNDVGVIGPSRPRLTDRREIVMAMRGKAVVIWSGSLASGEGHANFESGAGETIPVTCALEDHTPAGKSSPEELLAAAHASCFAMAISQMLTMGHHKPEQVRVAVTTTLDQVNANGPYLITREELDISGRVPGLDEAGFLQAVEAAKTMCAVGLALKGNVEIVYKARFEASANRQSISKITSEANAVEAN